VMAYGRDLGCARPDRHAEEQRHDPAEH
jgi:hypothetical protein